MESVAVGLGCLYGCMRKAGLVIAVFVSLNICTPWNWDRLCQCLCIQAMKTRLEYWNRCGYACLALQDMKALLEPLYFVSLGCVR